MSYDDPAHVRDNPIKSRFNDEEFAVVKAIARLRQQQPAVYVRELVLSHIASTGAQITDDARAA